MEAESENLWTYSFAREETWETQVVQSCRYTISFPRLSVLSTTCLIWSAAVNCQVVRKQSTRVGSGKLPVRRTPAVTRPDCRSKTPWRPAPTPRKMMRASLHPRSSNTFETTTTATTTTHLHGFFFSPKKKCVKGWGDALNLNLKFLYDQQFYITFLPPSHPFSPLSLSLFYNKLFWIIYSHKSLIIFITLE